MCNPNFMVNWGIFGCCLQGNVCLCLEKWHRENRAPSSALVQQFCTGIQWHLNLWDITPQDKFHPFNLIYVDLGKTKPKKTLLKRKIFYISFHFGSAILFMRKLNFPPSPFGNLSIRTNLLFHKLNLSTETYSNAEFIYLVQNPCLALLLQPSYWEADAGVFPFPQKWVSKCVSSLEQFWMPCASGHRGASAGWTFRFSKIKFVIEIPFWV